MLAYIVVGIVCRFGPFWCDRGINVPPVAYLLTQDDTGSYPLRRGVMCRNAEGGIMFAYWNLLADHASVVKAIHVPPDGDNDPLLASCDTAGNRAALAEGKQWWESKH